jgi:hypothetical protein
MSQPSTGPLFTQGDRRAAVEWLAGLNEQQQANVLKMVNHQPVAKRMYNMAAKAAMEAWNSQPGQKTREFAGSSYDVGRTAVTGTYHVGEAAVRGTGRVAAATVDAVRNPTRTLAAGRDLAKDASGALKDGAKELSKSAWDGVKKSTLGRWVQDKWSRTTLAAQTAVQVFADQNNNPNSPKTSIKDRLDLGERAASVVHAQTPDARDAAFADLLASIQTQIDSRQSAAALGGMTPPGQAVAAGAGAAAQGTEAQAQGQAPRTGTQQPNRNQGNQIN